MDFNIFDAIRSGVEAAGLPLWVNNVAGALVKALMLAVLMAVNALILVLLERKVAGHIQNRPGPNRLGPGGIIQTFADAIKLISKEDVVPRAVDRVVYALAPIVAFAPALAVWVVIPFTGDLVVRDLNIGLIYIAATTSIMVLSFLMAGWGSNNKWSLLGAMRAAAQLVSYEIPLVISVVCIAMLAGSLSLQDIVHAQQSTVWYILIQPLGFIIFLVASLAELNRAPFDLPEGESELVAGYNTEYSGFRWAIFFLTEYANLTSASAIMATLYFGGWSGPAFLPPIIWFLLKTYFFVFVAMWIRWTVPRIRVDQLMDISWKGLVPLSILNLVITGVYVLVR